MKRKPTCFYATCQCGVTIGAADAVRTDRKELGAILGKWLYSGCTVTPLFGGTESISVYPCKCASAQPNGEA